MLKKITIVGAGMVGESAALVMARDELSKELALFDIAGSLAEGKALDISQATTALGADTRVYGGSDPALMQGSDVVVITAGVPRKPGQSRQDILSINLPIIEGIMNDVVREAPDAIVLVVSNPVDVLTYRAWQVSGWSRQRVFGQAGVLDTARMKSFIADETGFSAKDIAAIVLGGHGDSMVPLMRHCVVNGISLSYFMSKEKMDEIAERTRKGGGEILELKKNTSAYDAPGVAICRMVDAICYDRNRILPTVAILEGEYGTRDIAMGVPCIMGREGLRKLVELELTAEEQADFDRSAAQVALDIAEMHQILKQ